MGNHMNTLEQIKRETRDDARLYACIRDLYDQGVSLSDLKALIPDIRRTREQLQLKRMLQKIEYFFSYVLLFFSLCLYQLQTFWRYGDKAALV